MPMIVTDGDVLAEIAKIDGIVASVDAALTSLASQVPASTAAAWPPVKASWATWKASATAQLSGGFFGGAWFGVPELGNQAVAWETQMVGWQGIVNTIKPGTLAASSTPIQIADANASLAPVLGSGSGAGFPLGLAVGIGASALLVFMLRK